MTFRLDRVPAAAALFLVSVCWAVAWPAVGQSDPPAAQSNALAPDTIDEPPITDFDREHWSFRPLGTHKPPALASDPLARNPIDQFIGARLEESGLEPMPPASKAVLLRRVTLDLTGLPPGPDELAAFESDKSDSAFESVVDRLLASPAYGERWAQHWLDLARYADTDGFELDLIRPEAWRYRDWVIQALNQDLPFDEFVRLQLAGDELNPSDRQASVATGFLLAGPDMPDINLPQERRDMVLNELTATVGAALLGLQLGCAQCHDHKFDPVSQAEFYRLRAVFDAAELFEPSPFGRVVHEKSGPVQPSYLMVRGDFRRPGPPVEPAFPRIANPWQDSVPSAASASNTSGRRTALARWLTRPDHALTARVIVNRLWQEHFGEGLVRTPNDFGLMGSAPTHAELLDWLATELTRRGWSLKQMHRLMVTSAVYRRSSGPADLDPASPEYAAALASLRHSRTVDPGNELLARMNRRRLDGESIRDCMLWASQRLSTRRGGPGVMPPLPEEVVVNLLKGQWQVSADEEDHRRRSIYLFVRRNLRYPLFEAFDRPDANASCPRRDRSTTAPQALVMLNSEFALQSARELAGYILQRAGASADARIDLAYRRVLSRPPRDEELVSSREFLAKQAALLRTERPDPKKLILPIPHEPANDPYEAAALVDLCLAMFNLNEFLYVD